MNPFPAEYFGEPRKLLYIAFHKTNPLIEDILRFLDGVLVFFLSRESFLSEGFSLRSPSFNERQNVVLDENRYSCNCLRLSQGGAKSSTFNSELRTGEQTENEVGPGPTNLDILRLQKLDRIFHTPSFKNNHCTRLSFKNEPTKAMRIAPDLFL